MKKLFSIMLLIGLMLSAGSSVYALPTYLDAFNAKYGTASTALNTCSLCHTSVPSRNPYGAAYGSNNHNFTTIEPMDSDGDGATNIVEINARTFPGNPASKPAPAPPAACTYTYSAWSACQSNNTQTRTVISSSPAGCVGTPVLSQACTYVPPPPAACTYTYSAWSACQPNNTQTRTVISSSPAGCTGTPVLSQACTYVPPAPGACTYTYSAWSACQPNNTRSRTVVSSSPAGCTGTPVLTEACTYVPPTPPPTTPPPTTMMPAPNGQMNFTYGPVGAPVVNPDPAKAKPIGFGSIASGGDTLSVKVDTGQFSSPVDVYFGVFAPTYVDLFDPMNVYMLGEAFDWVPAAEGDEVKKWKKGVTGVNEYLFGDIPVSDLTPGPYIAVLGVKPSDGKKIDSKMHDDDDDNDGYDDAHDGVSRNYYIWISYFVVQ